MPTGKYSPEKGEQGDMQIFAKEMILPKYPITGVLNANMAAWLWDEREIHLGPLGVESDVNIPPTSDCGDYPILYGGWVRVNGKYNPSDTCSFAAVFNPDSNTVQVVRSCYAVHCRPCSPCFPGQGDVDSDGSLFAYCLPPKLMSACWVNKNYHRILKLKGDAAGHHHWASWAGDSPPRRDAPASQICPG